MLLINSDQISTFPPNVVQLKKSATHSANFHEVAPAEVAKSTSLVFAGDKQLALIALKNNIKGLIIKENLWTELSTEITSEVFVWTTSNIQWAMSQILPLFDQKQFHLKQGIHPTAIIHASAQVDSTAHIGAHSVIEANSKIGAHTIIYPHVYVGYDCEIGSHCIIAPHTTIGSDGFGFFSDKTYTHHKIPQIGKVIIEDNCEIGAQCAIDRATLTETRIKSGTKLDNFCHIAHNVEIGSNSLITAGFIVAGSTKIGKNFTTAGGVHVNGHIQITDNVVMTGRAAATNDIKEPGIYGGFPLETHRESVKTLVSLPQIKTLKKQVNKILKHLNIEADN